MPQASIQVCCDSNWNPWASVSNAHSIQIVSAAVAIDASRATSLTSSGRRFETRTTQTAPIAGMGSGW